MEQKKPEFKEVVKEATKRSWLYKFGIWIKKIFTEIWKEKEFEENKS